MFNLFFKTAIVFKVLLNWQLAFTLLCSLIFVAGFCLLRKVSRDRVGIFLSMCKLSGRAFAAATVRCRGRGYIAFQSCKFRRKALRVTPRGKHWLTVYRAHQVKEHNNLNDDCQLSKTLKTIAALKNMLKKTNCKCKH